MGGRRQNYIPPTSSRDNNSNLIMLSLDISCYKNRVDPDQLASEKPADLDSHCFPLRLKKHANHWNSAKYMDKYRGGV